MKFQNSFFMMAFKWFRMQNYKKNLVVGSILLTKKTIETEKSVKLN